MTDVSISTVIAALKQAASEMGYTLSDALASLMIGQLRGAEGAYPGVKSSLGGTNNMGAAQVTKGLYTSKRGQQGWGAFAHKDSDPNQGSYIGWYWIAPSPLEAARYWLGGNWWGKSLLSQNPSDPTTYATILYKGRYFGGMHAGDPNHNGMVKDDSGAMVADDAAKAAYDANIADYAKSIQRGMASAAELSDAPGDPAAMTVDPTMFKSLDDRKITEDLFTKAKSGKIGGAWSYLLPDAWSDLQATNGVVWFGPPPPGASTGGGPGASGPLTVISEPVMSAWHWVDALPLWQKLALVGSAVFSVGLVSFVVADALTQEPAR